MIRTATYDDSKFKIVPIEADEIQIQQGCLSQTIGKFENYEDWWNSHSSGVSERIRDLIAKDYRAMISAAPEYQEPIPAKVILFNGVTSLDLNPNHILEAAKDRCEGVIVIGFKTDNEGLYASSSYADGGTVLWLIEKFKLNLLTGNHDEQSG